MYLRSFVIGFDEMLCAFQGYAGATFINAVANSPVINPIHAGLSLAILALTEKIYYQATKRLLPSETQLFAIIPKDLNKIVSMGLAIYTTVKIMQVAAIIITIPPIITAIGIGSGIILTGGAVHTAVKFAIKLRQAPPLTSESELELPA